LLDKIHEPYRAAFPDVFPDECLPPTLKGTIVVPSRRPNTALLMIPLTRKAYDLDGEPRDRLVYRFVLAVDGRVIPLTPQKLTHREDKKFCGRTEGVALEVVCNGCGKEIRSWKKCGRCKKTRYCDRACHLRHWRNGHREECVAPES